jgi:hypothetical protein
MRARMQGSRRLTTARQRGQSLPLIALMIVVLVAMVGLSVDVGNTFSEERQAVAAGNAASVAAMDAYIDRTGSTTNQSIYRTILNTLNSNGVDIIADPANPLPGQLQLEALYLDAQGKPLSSGSGSPFITNDTTKVPNNVAFIQVNLKGLVDTYFARVVGRDDLPINATSHAGTCPVGAGVYPIAIKSSYLDGDKFRDPGDRDFDGIKDNNWRVLPSGPYAGRTAMRLDVQAGDTPGGFTWLRWMEGQGATGANSNSARELEASLTIPGNLPAGFEEAPWPTPANEPANYPDRPGQLNVGDWVYGKTGYVNSTDPVMDLHEAEGTRMVLPIYETVLGTGQDTRYYVNNLGLFVLLDHGKEQGGGKFIELVYLGDAAPQQTACSYSAAPNPGETYSLMGQVQIRPEYAYVPTERKPIQYVVVLDTSGSMSANFAGQCDSKGLIQCTNGPDGAPAAVGGAGGNGSVWSTTEERRIYVAKTAIESLVRSTNMQGNGSNYDINRPVDQMALVWYNDAAPSGNTRGFSSVPGTIITDVRAAGRYGSDNYHTQGGTNGAAALYRAALMLDAAPKSVTDVAGKKWDYKRVVIFITDGVSNRFLDTSKSDLKGASSDKNTYPSSHVCHVNNVIEIASCQVTSGGGKYNGMDRPITQAGNVSKNDLQANGAEVYAISLSNIPATGLQDSIASFPKYYFAANTLEKDASGKTNVDKIMEVINTMVESGLCVQRSDVLDGKPEFKDTILPNEYQAFAGAPTYPTVGEVLLENVENGTLIRIPIMADSEGRTTYTKNDVPKGNYKLTPYVFYRHPLDPPTFGPRRYSLIDNGAGEPSSDMVITVGPQASQSGSFVQQNRQDLKLRLFGNVCTVE